MAKLRVSAGLNLHAFPKDDIFAYIRQGLLFHKSIGLDAADFSANSLLQLMGEDITGGIEKTKEIANEVGIAFELYHLPFGLTQNSTEEKVEIFNARVHEAIDAMALLGVNYAVVHPNVTTERRIEFDRKMRYDYVMAHLSPFAEHANRVGLNLVVENMRVGYQFPYAIHRYCGEPDELCEIADGLGVGICWDTGHAHLMDLHHADKQSEALRYVGKRLKMLHINDNFGEDDIHLAPFMGKVDWADTMQGLAAIDYQGLLNYEVRVPGTTPALRKAYGDYLYNAAQDLMDLMG